MNGHACNKTLPVKTGVGTPFTNCWDELPVQNAVLNSHTELGGVQTFSVTTPFSNCGYEFNPYEYKTCRPFTIVSMAANDHKQCVQNAVTGADGTPPINHLRNKIQIDDYPTRSPTNAPSDSPTLAPSLAPSIAPSITPTQPPSIAPSLAPSISPSIAPSITPTQPPSLAPSLAPSLIPTNSPVSPTRQPTDPTITPTNAPSTAPTAKPTDLPTVNVTTLDFPPCPGLRIKHLDVLFPVEQSVEEFTQTPQIYNRRRTWSNGRLSVHFEDRFADGGDWIITNGTYTAISIEDANYNNSAVYNTSNPNAIAPHSLPGPYPYGYVYYDHFPHDNILSKPNQEVTLHFECYSSGHPTDDPSPSPTTAEPTDSPTSLMPTLAPTANCTGFCMRNVWALECKNTIANLFVGCALKQEDNDGHARWIGVGDIEGYIIYFSPFHLQWIIHGTDGYTAVATIGSSKYPPIQTLWDVFDNNNAFAITCKIRIRYTCYDTGIPTEAPTRSPTTAYPTTNMPTHDPTLSPSNTPTQPPSISPSNSPTQPPSISPTQPPTNIPSWSPVLPPSIAPTFTPSITPTLAPTIPPTLSPSYTPTLAPSITPTFSPTMAPISIKDYNQYFEIIYRIKNLTSDQTLAITFT
eukprot:970344_1